MTVPRLVPKPELPANALDGRTDDELMALAQANLKDAFAVLVRRHATRIVALCSRYVNDPHRGKELAQDVWVKAWRARDSYRTSGGFVVWLVTVARNHCRNELRRPREVASYDETLAPADARYSAEQLDALLARERSRKVQSALSELADPLREALLLRYGEELRYDEMATVTDTGESTLRSRVHHGLKLLKRILEKDS